MKHFKKLIKEYALNTDLLIITSNNKYFSEYHDFFETLFRKIDYISYTEVIEEELLEFSQSFQFIILELTDSTDKSGLKTILEKIHNIKNENELLPVYTLKDTKNCIDFFDILVDPLDIDDCLLFPFEKNKLEYSFYKILHKTTTINNLYSYITYLESEVGLNTMIDTNLKDTVSIVDDSKDKKVLHDRRKDDLRFSQRNKISATDFRSTLDETIIDKVETLTEHFDDFISRLYDFDDASDPSKALTILHDINFLIQNSYATIDTLVAFPVTVRAFQDLENFLNGLSVEELENQANKKMLAKMLISIIQDLEKWLNIIFIEQSTDDIHYLDASFASNVVEIEAIFTEIDDDDDDDDDLEFF